MPTSSVRARCAAFALLALTACQATEKLAPVDAPAAPPPAVKQYAFFLNFDLVSGTVTVQEPRRDSAVSREVGANSLTGAEIVGVAVANMTRSATGQFVANKRTVNFDLTLTNKLSTADLVTPTFPVLPTGVQGILAFPYTVAVSGTQGGKATADTSWNGDGTSGSGAPINFFNDFDDCTNGANADCYRWVLFPSPLTPGHSTPARRVGFTVDKNVTSMSIYLVVAADLADHPPVTAPGLGALTGRVLLGADPAVGATVTLTPGNLTTTVDAQGQYLFTGLAVGTYSAAVSKLPSNCPVPPTQNAPVTSGGVATANFLITCTTSATTGTIHGSLTSPQLGPLTGRPVQLIGATSAILVGQTATAADGSFSFADVVPGSYRVQLGVLPLNCTDPFVPVVIVTAGADAQVTITVACPPTTPPPPPPPGTGNVTGTIGSVDLGPFSAKQIILYTSGFTFRQASVTGPDGAFLFNGVDPGNYVVVLAEPPAACSSNISAVFTVTADQTTTLNIQLPCPNAAPPPQTTVLSGVVTRNDEPMDGVTISVKVGSQTYTSTTGGAGTFRFGPEIFPGGVSQVNATISVSGFPSNCAGPADIPVTLRRDQGIDLPIVVTCGAGLRPMDGRSIH